MRSILLITCLILLTSCQVVYRPELFGRQPVEEGKKLVIGFLEATYRGDIAKCEFTMTSGNGEEKERIRPDSDGFFMAYLPPYYVNYISAINCDKATAVTWLPEKLTFDIAQKEDVTSLGLITFTIGRRGVGTSALGKIGSVTKALLFQDMSGQAHKDVHDFSVAARLLSREEVVDKLVSYPALQTYIKSASLYDSKVDFDDLNFRALILR